MSGLQKEGTFCHIQLQNTQYYPEGVDIILITHKIILWFFILQLEYLFKIINLYLIILPNFTNGIM